MKPTATGLPTFEIAEWQSRIIDGESLTSSDYALKLKLEAGKQGRLFVDELRAGVRITAQSWVGIVRFERFEVRILPKLAGDNLGLVEMIEYSTGLSALRRNSSARTLHAEGTGLFDLLALLLVEAIENILRGGLLADYVEREDDLPVLRGRLLGDQQILRRFGQVDRVVCRYDEHEQNIVENQLLAAALGRCASRVRHDSTRQRVRRLFAIFQEICRTDELDLETARSQVTYNRLNERYRNAHALAWLLLDGLGTRDLFASGKTHCFSFMIDMNRLFEMFISRLVDRLLATTEVRVHIQHRDQSIILNALTNRPYAKVIPDLLIEKKGIDSTVLRVAIDAKYKLYDERKLNSGDIYQTFMYAFAYGGAGGKLPAALLIYPSSTRKVQSHRLRIQSAQAIAGAEILALGLPIPEILIEITQNFCGPVTKALMEAVLLQGLGGIQLAAA